MSPVTIAGVEVMGRKAHQPVAAVLLATLVILAACGARERSRTEPSASPAIPTEEAQLAVESLCRMQDSGIAEGEAAAAFGVAHDSLHEIAVAIEPFDRSSAARLLEAKSVVEAALEAGHMTSGFGRSVRVLENRTIDALRVLGISTRAC